TLGDIAFAEGRGEEALELLAESARLTGAIGFRWFQSSTLMSRGEYALELGRPDEAEPSLREGLALAREIGDRQSAFFGVSLLAWLAAVEGRLEEAGRLWGALEADAEQAPVGQWELERELYTARLRMGMPEFERGRAEGRRLSLGEAVELALAGGR